MTDKIDLRSQALDLLRFPLAVVIVLVHTTMVSGNFLLLDGKFIAYDHSGYIILSRIIAAFIQNQSVPIYYFISGYVFFLGIELSKDVYLRKIRNRIRTLLVPYLVWNMVFILLYWLKTLPYMSSFSNEEDIVFGWREFFMSFWGYTSTDSFNWGDGIFPMNYPLWFLRDLIIVVIFTPIINVIIKYCKLYYIVSLGILWFMASILQWGRVIQLSNAFFFFSLGAYMSVNNKDMVAVFGKYFKLSTIMFLILGVAFIIVLEYSPVCARIIKTTRILVGLLFAYNLAVYLLKKGYCKVNKFLASSSFFIYLSHAWVFERVRRLIFSAIDLNSDFWIIIAYLLTVFVTISLLLLAYYCGKRFMPGIFKVMIGGR